MRTVIMAGGRGQDSGPAAEEKKPKHLLDIVSKRTIIQETFSTSNHLSRRRIYDRHGKKSSRELMTAAGNS